ncbi:MAG: type IX secretion system membrane protein PorP/SprF [Bacteroidia bacterium]|nr:type IX secretion system membrane protein PorP/SprF [Bacteroidia bacterium]
MKTIKRLGIACVLLLMVLPAFGQQDPQYSMYMFNGLALNPAYAGSREAISATFLLRKQWVGIEGAPFTQSLAVHGPSRNERHGFGVQVVNDYLGITHQLWILPSYAYRIPMGAGHLSLGLQAGMLNYQNKWSKVTTGDPDNVLPKTDQSLVLPEVGTGIYYNTQRFFAGVSMPNILKNVYKDKSNPAFQIQAQQVRHIFATTGVVIPLTEDVDFRPSVLFKYAEGAPMQFDLNASVMFKKAFWLGASFRTGDAVLMMAEYVHNYRWRVGYAFDYSISKLNQFNRGSHEVMLGFDFGFAKKRVLSPRFF